MEKINKKYLKEIEKKIDRFCYIYKIGYELLKYLDTFEILRENTFKSNFTLNKNNNKYDFIPCKFKIKEFEDKDLDKRINQLYSLLDDPHVYNETIYNPVSLSFLNKIKKNKHYNILEHYRSLNSDFTILQSNIILNKYVLSEPDKYVKKVKYFTKMFQDIEDGIFYTFDPYLENNQFSKVGIIYYPDKIRYLNDFKKISKGDRKELNNQIFQYKKNITPSLITEIPLNVDLVKDSYDIAFFIVILFEKIAVYNLRK